MSITLWEPIINALKTRLETNLPAFITAVNTQTTPDFPVDNITNVFDYVPTIADLSSFPCIGIAEGDLVLEDDTGWGATGVAIFSIVIFEQHADQRALAWHLRRLAEAVTRCVLQNRTLPPEGWSVNLARVRPGPTLGRDENPRQWYSTVTVQIEVKFQQDTP